MVLQRDGAADEITRLHFNNQSSESFAISREWNSTPYLMVTNGGKIGIGEEEPAEALDVVGNIEARESTLTWVRPHGGCNGGGGRLPLARRPPYPSSMLSISRGVGPGGAPWVSQGIVA